MLASNMDVTNQSDSALTMLYPNITMDSNYTGYNNPLNGSLYNTLQVRSSSYRTDHSIFLFIFFTIITGLLCVLGFIGNFICILVLQKDRGGTAPAATLLLQALAVADNLVLGMAFIFLSIIFGLLPILNATVFRKRMIPYIVTYFQPIAHMGQTATVWMTVLLAVNRYIAVCRPLETHRLASFKKTKMQVAIVFMFAFILNFPRFFQYTIVHSWNTKLNMNIPFYKETSIGPTTVFGVVYSTWLYTIIVHLLPLLLLLVLNTKLILQLKKVGKRRDSVNRKTRRLEVNITLVMIVIILVFIICNTPDRINELVKYFKNHPEQFIPEWFYFDCVSQFFVVVNSSTNFLIYYIFRRRFRQVLLQKLCFEVCCHSKLEVKPATQIPVCESIVT